MKTKLFTLFLALVASVGTMFASVEINGIAYNLNEAGHTAEVTTSSPNYSGDILIPESVAYNATTYSVTSIGSYAFSDCTGLSSVIIPNSVTSIGNSAFKDCSGLTSVTIPNSVTSIEVNAFYGCKGLTLVTFGNGLVSIGVGAFEHCTGLTSVSIPNSVTNIGGHAFEHCSGLTSVTIPNSVTSIGSYAFSDCTGLSSVIIPNSVTSIGNGAFRDCTGLTSVTIPNNSVTSIEIGAFSGCTGLTSVTIPNSIKSIGKNAFLLVNNIIYSGSATGSPWGAKSVNGYVDGCLVYSDAAKTTLLGCSSASTGEIVILNSVTSIGEDAFYRCTGLTSVTIPNSVTSIGWGAFYGCSSLTSVTNYATTPQTIESDVFGGNDFYPGVNKSTCVLNVPNESVSLYQAAEGWKEFTNIVGVDVPFSAPAVYTNPANPAQKLIKNGQVLILRGNKTFTLHGQELR